MVILRGEVEKLDVCPCGVITVVRVKQAVCHMTYVMCIIYIWNLIKATGVTITLTGLYRQALATAKRDAVNC